LTTAILRRWTFLAAVLGVLVPSAARAFSLTPIEADFSPSGRGAAQVFRIENTTASPIAVEISAKQRKMLESGEDELSDADDQFTIVPAQLVLQPGQAQSVRVQYVGAPAVQVERAFRLIAEQLPIDVGQAPAANAGQMRLLVRYVASIYVVPAAPRAVLSVRDVKLTQSLGRPTIEFLVVNEGTSRRVMRGLRLDVGGAILSGQALTGVEGENVLAGTQRRFRIPAPAGITTVPTIKLLLE
jgi:fimbrial chaperone protein